MQAVASGGRLDLQQHPERRAEVHRFAVQLDMKSVWYLVEHIWQEPENS
jgi:hypothetical protein